MKTAAGMHPASAIGWSWKASQDLLRWIRKGRFRRYLPVLFSWALGFGIWEIVGRSSSPFVFASFSDSVAAFWKLLENGILFRHAKVSMQELGIGFSIGAAIGITGGALAAFSRTFRDMTDHWITAFLSTPFAAIFPIFLVWFGLGLNSKIALAVFASFMPVWINTHTGVISVDRRLVEVTRAFGGNWLQALRWVVLPWSLPSLIEGLRFGLSRAFLAVIVGELLASQAGLGFLINLSGATLRIDNLLAAVMVVTGITIALVEIMKLAQRVMVPWWEERA
ncbi:MAG: ABC transporter permease [Dehalococcoidia bacterium]